VTPPRAHRTAVSDTSSFDDRLLRPFLVIAMVAVVAAQLATSPVPDAAAASWPFFVPVALLALWSITPVVQRMSTWSQVVLLAAYAVLAAVLFPIPAQTFSAGFVFMATLAAGQLIRSPRLAVLVAVIGGVACAATNFLYDQAAPSPWPWWLGFTAVLPVYIGLARRQRVDALRTAHLVALETERAAASEAREAALLERGRIARDLHDVLGHSLSGIAIQLDLAQVLRAQGRETEADAAVVRARAIARSGVSETRSAIHALHEDRLPLAETIQAIAEDHGAACSVLGIARTMTVDKSHAFIRTAQESLTNAHRHAPGAPMEVTLEFADGWCHLTVENEAAHGPAARGAASSDDRGMGRAGMQERARLLGGACRSGPVEGGRWRVVMALPL
jgi:signal transduction histidine kinase